MNYPRRLIEVDLPIAQISAAAKSETRPGHIRALHTWWARRPLAACRSVLLAGLWPDPADPLCPDVFRDACIQELTLFRNRWGGRERDLSQPDELRAGLLELIAHAAEWRRATDIEFLSMVRRLVAAAHVGYGGVEKTRPLVLDPFAGGGAIPFEALRVGADAIGMDLNPVAALINRVLLEQIPRFGEKLADLTRQYGRQIAESVVSELRGFYPSIGSGEEVYAYIWARTVVCEGPGCGFRIPVTRSLWLDETKKAPTYLKLDLDQKNQAVLTTVASDGRPDRQPTARRGSVSCPNCGFTTPRKKVEEQAQRRGLGQQLLAVAVDGPVGRRYVQPSAEDFEALAQAERRAKELSAQGLVPTEELPYLRSIFNVHLYGMNEWGKLFSSRQQVFAAELVQRVAGLRASDLSDDPDLGRAVKTALAFATDKALSVSCSVARWRSDTGRLEGAFAMQALPMVWDWGEINPLREDVAVFMNAIDAVSEVIYKNAGTLDGTGTARVSNATKVPLPDDSVGFVFTDPPYYDYIPYADLSDFFYVWLRRMVGEDYQDFFSDATTPKDTELVQLAERNVKYAGKTKEAFQAGMQSALEEARRVLTPDGLCCVVFAHKTTAGWESLLSGLIAAGWTVTASWPIDTELQTRWKAIGTASLASSVHLACRPREHPDGSLRDSDVGEWREILEQLPVRIHDWMPRLAEEGIVGADAIFACLGPALELFSRYVRVEKASGETVELSEFLEQVWAAVAREALSLVFEDADTTGFEPDARVTAMWLWTLSGAAPSSSNGDSSEPVSAGAFSLEFDAARKIAQGLGAHLESLMDVVEVKGDTARLRSVTERTRFLFGSPEEARASAKKDKAQLSLFSELSRAEAQGGWGDRGAPRPGTTILDQVHQAMILFAAGRGEALRRFLVDGGAGSDPRFWRLAQALSALYPSATEEKRWIDGVLVRKKTLGF